DLDKVKLIEAFIVTADGKRKTLPPGAFSRRRTDQAEAAPGFSSLREFEIRFDGLKVGEASYFKVELQNVKSSFDNRFDTLEMFPPNIAWKSVEVSVSSPPDDPLYIEANGFDGGKVADANGRSQWVYKKPVVPPFEADQFFSELGGVSARVAVTTFKGADELGAAYWQGMKQKAIVTAGMQAL